MADMRPYYSAVEQGGDPEQAWDSTAPVVSANMQLGLWKKDLMAAAAGSSRCQLPEVQCVSCRWAQPKSVPPSPCGV